MKVLLIAGFKPDLLAYNGVAKKIDLEIRTFRKLGHDVDYLEFSLGRVFLSQESGVREFLVNEDKSFYKTMNLVYKALLKRVKIIKCYDLMYVRYESFSFFRGSFFKAIKKKDGKVRIVGELPTYVTRPAPRTSVRNQAIFYIKKWLNFIFSKNIDYIATFSDHEVVFNIPTIQIENFVDLDIVKLRHPVYNDRLDILAVAQLAPQHGYDRLIRGLKNYYEGEVATKVIFHIVGDGVEKDNLKRLTYDLNLEKYVKFYGLLGGRDLDELFNLGDIGVASLASFRRGASKTSDLKIREYTARGLPFIYTAKEPQIEQCYFARKIAFDESPVDIHALVQFNNELKMKSPDLMQEMRVFAEDQFSCDSQLKKVLNSLNVKIKCN